MGNQYGYIRVSSKGQNEDRQVVAMHELQIPSSNIYIDNKNCPSKRFQSLDGQFYFYIYPLM